MNNILILEQYKNGMFIYDKTREECVDLEEAFNKAQNELHHAYKLAGTFNEEDDIEFIRKNGILYHCKIKDSDSIYVIHCKGEYKTEYICNVVSLVKEPII